MIVSTLMATEPAAAVTATAAPSVNMSVFALFWRKIFISHNFYLVIFSYASGFLEVSHHKYASGSSTVNCFTKLAKHHFWKLTNESFAVSYFTKDVGVQFEITIKTDTLQTSAAIKTSWAYLDRSHTLILDRNICQRS